jgi:arabinofuranan 3-O-arabinosyltransferase
MIRVESYLNVGSLRANPRVQVLPADPKTRTLAFAPAPLPPEVDLADVGPVGDCHRLDERSAAQVGLEAKIVRESDARLLRLTARDHSACVNFAIAPIQRGARAYRIRFDYRGASGRPPRVCLWQEGPDRCASLPPLRARRAWQAVDETIKLDAEVRALRLFLYADGGGERPTIAEYRDIHVGPVGSVAVVGIPKERPLPRLVVRREASWKFHVLVEGAKAPFLLATSEAFADGWKATAEGHDDSALRHVEVNGYANGWLVPFAGTYEMTLEYGPERYARAARLLSILSLIGVLGFVGLRRLRAFDVGRHGR